MSPKNMSITALVCGILGIVGAWIPIVCYITLILSIIGIVFGVKGRKECAENEKGLATAGLVLGIIGVAFGAIGVICAICVIIGAAALGTSITG